MQLSPAMQKSMLAPIFQDYTSALFPGAAAVAARLADAAGIPHTAIGLFVMQSYWGGATVANCFASCRVSTSWW